MCGVPVFFNDTVLVDVTKLIGKIKIGNNMGLDEGI